MNKHELINEIVAFGDYTKLTNKLNIARTNNIKQTVSNIRTVLTGKQFGDLIEIKDSVM